MPVKCRGVNEEQLLSQHFEIGHEYLFFVTGKGILKIFYATYDSFDNGRIALCAKSQSNDYGVVLIMEILVIETLCITI